MLLEIRADSSPVTAAQASPLLKGWESVQKSTITTKFSNYERNSSEQALSTVANAAKKSLVYPGWTQDISL